MDFQIGDETTEIDGQLYHLRLTIGALAAISEQLSAPSPKALCERLRALSAGQARVLLTYCCLSPLRGGTRSVAALSDAQITQALPALCRLFETAFSAGETDER